MGRHFEKKKQDIVDPQNRWLKVNLRDFVYDTFDTIDFRKSDIFDHKKIVAYYDNFIKQKTNT